MYLRSGVPDRVAREMGREGDEDPSSLRILDALLHFVSPGGEAEADSLREFVRNRGAPEGVQASRDLLAELRLALARLDKMNLPGLSAG